MKTIKEIPDDYRITEQDENEAWKLFASKSEYIALSKKSRGLVEVFIEAGRMQRTSGVWPTFGEVCESRAKENDAYWQKHFGRNAPREEEEEECDEQQTA